MLKTASIFFSSLFTIYHTRNESQVERIALWDTVL